MGTSYGRQVFTPVVVNPLMLLANLDGVFWHPVGITLDWATFAAVSGSPVTLNDGTVVPVGQKAARYGQVLTLITASGLWGPYDSTATDGRQLRVRSKIVLLNETVVENGLIPGWVSATTNHPPVFERGLVWADRLLDSTHADPLGQPTGPTLAQIEAVLDVRYQYA